MNIKELINIYQGTVEDKFEAGVVRDIYEGVLEDLKQLDEFAKLTKVEIPQCAIDEIEGAKKQGYSLFKAMNINDKSGEFRDWIEKPENQEVFARAWSEGYIVKETKYVVTDGNHLYFKGYQEDVDIVILADEQPGTMYYVKKFDTKEEAQKVADVLGWKVEEVV